MKSKIKITVFFFLMGLSLIQAQPVLSWAKNFGGSVSDLNYSLGIDNNSNVYSYGVFSDTIDIDPGTSTINLIADGSQDLFFQKLDAAGNFIFGYSLPCDSEKCGKMAVGNNGQGLILTGSFKGQTDFDFGSGTALMNSQDGTNFILKLSSQGQLIWTKQFGNSNFNSCEITALTYDDSSNVFVSGNYSDTIDLSTDSSEYFVFPKIGQNVFLAKYNSSGNLVWAKTFHSNNKLFVSSAYTSQKGVLSVAGFYSDSLNFNSNTNLFNLISMNFSSDIFICQLNPSGDLIWSRSFGGKLDDFAYCVDGDDCDNIYFGGSFQDSIDVGSSGNSVFIESDSLSDGLLVKLNSLGQIKWVRVLGGNKNQIISDVEVNLNGDIFTTGVFEDTLQLIVGGASFVSNGGIDILNAKFDALGNFLCIGQVGGAGIDSVYGIAINERDEIFLGGSFESNCDFDPASTSYLITSNGSKDAFAIKFLRGTCCLVSQPPDLVSASPKEFCSGESSALSVTPQNEGTCPNFVWYSTVCGSNFQGTGDTISVSPQFNSTYYVRVEGPCDTSLCKTVNVTVNPKPVAYFEYSIIMNCEGPKFTLSNKSVLADSYTWVFSNGNSSTIKNPGEQQFSYSEQIKIILIAKNTFGCSDTFSISNSFAGVEDYYNLIIPNIFTPNNDGLNDYYAINFFGEYSACFSINIFDRWGFLLFSSIDPSFRWDGKTLHGQNISDGVYFYVLEIAGTKHRGFLTVAK